MENKDFTNSPLITYTNITKHKTPNRNHEIDTITIHCYVGQVTAKQGCDMFATTDRQVSSNYVVGKDGSIGLSVNEKDRSWCSSNSANDHRAITIEVASDETEPYAVTDEAYNALIQLVADICKRNNIKKLLWKGDKSLIGQVDKQNMTVHRWFANKSCPGTYLYERLGDIAAKVNAILSQDEGVLYRVQSTALFADKTTAEGYLSEIRGAGAKNVTLTEETVIATKEIASTIEVGSTVRVNQGANVYGTNRKYSEFVYEKTYTVKEISGERVVIAEGINVIGAVNVNDLTLMS